MTSHVLLSSERQDWQTPAWFLDLVRAVGRIGYDPATVSYNPTRAVVFCSELQSVIPGWIGPCGLRAAEPHLPDGFLNFTNPPYGAHLSGPIEPDYQIVRKGVHVGTGRGWAAKIAGFRNESIALTPVRSETEWWTTLFHASTLALLWKSDTYGSRISFVDPASGMPVQGSNLASTVFYSGPRPERFAEVFGPHGTLIKGGK